MEKETIYHTKFRDSDFSDMGRKRIYTLVERLRKDITNSCVQKEADELNKRIDNFILRYQNESLNRFAIN